jgi:hypothetical protein
MLFAGFTAGRFRTMTVKAFLIIGYTPNQRHKKMRCWHLASRDPQLVSPCSISCPSLNSSRKLS